MFFLLGLQSKADHDMGYELRHKHIQNNKYQIILTLYDDCRFSSATPSATEIWCSGGNTTLSTLDSTVVTELGVFCPSIITKCNGGTADGFRKSVFYYSFDLDDTSYSTLKGCSTLNVKTNIGSVYSSKTGTNTQIAQMTMNLDTNQRNSSPAFTIDPNPVLCCNTPASLEIGATDADGDSLSFEWGQATNNGGGFINYSTGSYANPITTYYPPGFTYPFNSPLADPPIGIYLDNKTGKIVFTPTSCTESTLVTLQVNEWRKDTSGTPQLIGSSRRVMKYLVVSCSGNDLPEISGPTSVSICLGDSINILYTSGEQQSNLPQLTIPPDSVTLTWNKEIDGATFTVVPDTGRYESALFSWKPDSSVQLNKPHRFVITATDDHCPLQGRTTQVVNITVRNQVIANLSKQKLGCGTTKYTVLSEVACLDGDPIFHFELLDIGGQTLSHTSGLLSFVSSSNVATVQIKKPGRYIVKATLKNDQNTFSRTFVDTLDYTDLLAMSLSTKSSVLCLYDTLSIAPQVENPLGNPVLQWTTDRDNDTSSGTSFEAYIAQPNEHLLVFIDVTDQSGCHVYDTVSVSNNFLMGPKIENDTFCSDQTPMANISGDYSDFIWNGVSGDSVFTIDHSMTLRVSYTDSNSCTYHDTAYYKMLPAPIINLKDTTHCGIPYQLNAGNYPVIEWNTGSKTSKISIAQTGNYSLLVKNEFGCEATDTASITVLDFDARTLTKDTILCSDRILLYPGNYDSYLWSDGKTTQTLSARATGQYFVKLRDTNGCARTDSIDVKLLVNRNIPTLTKVGDRIQSSESGTHKWFKNNTIQVAKTNNYLITKSKGVYTALTVDANGCESDTSNPYLITLSTTSLDLEKLTVYPNPTNGKVTIDATGLGNIQNIKLYNTNSKLVENTQAVNGSLIDLSWEARSGIYWVVVTTDKGIFRSEVVSVR